MADENPYLKMPTDVLIKHIEQVADAVKGKTEIDVTQMFGVPTISADDQVKIDEHATLTSQVEKLSADASAKDLTPDMVRISQVSIDSSVGGLKGIDKDVPLESVLSSKFNNMEKLDILGIVKPIVEHYSGVVETIRKEVGSKDPAAVDQKFSTPEDKDATGAKIIAEMVPKKKE